MKNKILLSLLASLSILAYASDMPSTKVTDQIKQNLSKNLPDLVVDRVLTTPFKGVYEVDSGRKIFYVDETGSYAMIGNMLDLSNKQSLTEKRTTDLNIVDWNKLPLDVAIRTINGNGKNRIAIFTDPDCPFCKRLEQETVSKLKNVTIYYFLYPLPIHPNAENDSKKILCAENSESALLAFMNKDASLGKITTCKNADRLTKMKDAANNQVQVTGTPTIVLPNGRIISGLVPADYLTNLIDSNQESK